MKKVISTYRRLYRMEYFECGTGLFVMQCAILI